mgnify:CR=1 FL=1
MRNIVILLIALLMAASLSGCAGFGAGAVQDHSGQALRSTYTRIIA